MYTMIYIPNREATNALRISRDSVKNMQFYLFHFIFVD